MRYRVCGLRGSCVGAVLVAFLILVAGCSGESSAYTDAVKVYDEFMHKPIYIEESGDEYVAQVTYRHRGRSFAELATSLDDVADMHMSQDPEGAQKIRDLASLCREYGDVLVSLSEDLDGVNNSEVIEGMEKYKKGVSLLRRIYSERATLARMLHE